MGHRVLVRVSSTARPQLSSAQPLDLIVVLDGGSSRLAAAARLRQRISYGDPQRALQHEPDLLLIRCPRSSPVPQPIRELLQGYDTATQITVLTDWLRRRQAQPPQRIWIATDPERTARATLLARIALAGRGIQIQPDPPPPPSPGERRKQVRDALRIPRFQESCHPSDQYTRGLEDMSNASLQRGRQG